MYINSATLYFLAPKHGLHLQFFLILFLLCWLKQSGGMDT